jgi:hypothetical protein
VKQGLARVVLGSVACAALLGACGDDAAGDRTFSPLSSQRIGGDGVQWPVALAAGRGRTVISALYFDDRFALGSRLYDAAGGVDAIVFALDDAGNQVWAAPLAGMNDDFIVGVATMEDGAVLVGGSASAGASFAGRTLDVTGETAAMVAKVDAYGHAVWLHVAQGTGFQGVTAVAPTSDGGAYVAGDFTEDFDLGAGPVTASDLGDGFLARYDADGALQWFKVVGGAGIQHIEQVAVGPSGEAVIIGHFRGELALGAAPMPGNPASDHTPFVARFQADGSLAWAQTKLLPAELNHQGHLDYMEVHHPGVAVSELSVAVSPGGGVAAGVTYGGSFAHLNQDFEAPRIDKLVLTSISADGAMVSQEQLTTMDGTVRLGKVVADRDRTYLSTSWTGQLMGTAGGEPLASASHASLLIAAPSDTGQLEPVGQWSLDEAALESVSAALGPDGSLVVAASRTDLSSLDRDVFLARFH